MTARPAPLPLADVTLADLARRHGLELRGPDGPVRFLARMKQSRSEMDRVLTYVTSAEWLTAFAAGDHEAAVVERRFAHGDPPDGRAWLVCDGSAEEGFFRIHLDSVASGRTTFLEAARGEGCVIHPAATVMDHVRLGRDCRIDAGAVLYPNTVVGDRTHIQANATLGGEGFEAKYIGGVRRIVPHTGGVFVADDCSIGSATCIDRGLFGTFTAIGVGSQVDNLVHIAHNVDIGADCGVVACALVAGSAVLGRGVWFGPHAVCNHEIRFGDYAYVGTGAVVVRDVPAHGLVYGSPAKVHGWACRCRTKVALDGERATCPKCGSVLVMQDGQVRLLDAG